MTEPTEPTDNTKIVKIAKIVKIDTTNLSKLAGNDSDHMAIAKKAAAFCLERNIKANDFITLFKKQLVQVLKQADPEIANVQIAVRTGLDRRTITSNKQTTKISKDMLVLSYLQSYCQTNQVTQIKKKGPYNTFAYFCTLAANGSLTPNAIAQELLRLGHIEDKGSNYKILF